MTAELRLLRMICADATLTLVTDHDKKTHWETVYATKARDEVSWFREHLDTSLEMINKADIAKTGAIIDVGGGNSTLPDDLLGAGFTNITVLDISGTALAASKERLGQRAGLIDWIESDITAAALPENYFDLWHDRAVFHFLSDSRERSKYIELVKRAVRTGGNIIIAAFAADGPEKCSGLAVTRYSAEKMHAEFGSEFDLVDTRREIHNTPFGTTQSFIYCHFQKV